MKKLIYLSVLAFFLGACGSGSTTEEKVDDATDEMEETMEEAGDDAEEAVEEAGDAVEETVEEVEE